MTQWLGIFLILSSSQSLSYLVIATTTTSSSFSASCVPGVHQTSFPNCNNFNSYTTCADLSTDQQWKSCLCNQNYLNSLFGCESEMRVCFENNYLDISYESALSDWHSLCDTFTTFPISTPRISTVATTFLSLCNVEACQTARILLDNCESTYTNDDNLFTSCLCQPKFLTLDYSCEYLGNTSCLGIPATMSELAGYDCPNFAAVIGTGLAPQSVVTVSAPSTTSSLSVTPGPTRSSTTATKTSTAVTTSSSSTGARVACVNGLIYLSSVYFFLRFL